MGGQFNLGNIDSTKLVESASASKNAIVSIFVFVLDILTYLVTLI